MKKKTSRYINITEKNKTKRNIEYDMKKNTIIVTHKRNIIRKKKRQDTNRLEYIDYPMIRSHDIIRLWRICVFWG